jgi:hypothetical protein
VNKIVHEIRGKKKKKKKRMQLIITNVVFFFGQIFTLWWQKQIGKQFYLVWIWGLPHSRTYQCTRCRFTPGYQVGYQSWWPWLSQIRQGSDFYFIFGLVNVEKNLSKDIRVDGYTIELSWFLFYLSIELLRYLIQMACFNKWPKIIIIIN